MTKFKQGDRVVPEQFDGGLWTESMVELVNVPGEITDVDYHGHCKVHHHWWPSSALRPASPKWEPVTGQEYYLIGSNQVVKYIGYNEESKEYVFYHKENDLYDAWLLEYIRPIAPSMEEEVGSILCKLIGGDNYILRDAKADIMAIFNRHKEGGQNDND